MILVTYPIMAFEKMPQIINHPDYSLRMFDTTNKEDAMKVFLMLLAQFGTEFQVFNIASRSSQSRLENLDNLVDSINHEELEFGDVWCVALSLDEEDVMEVLKNYKRDFIIVENGKPICFSNNQIVVYGDIEEAYEEVQEGELYCLLSIADPQNDGLYDVHVLSMNNEYIEEIFVYKASENTKEWFETSYDELCKLFEKKEVNPK